MSNFNNGKKKEPQKQKSQKIAAIILPAVMIVIVTVIVIMTFSTNNKQAVQNSDLTIQISEVTDKVNFYPAEADGTKLEVMAVKAPDGTIRTAFNTCQVCYSSGKGYYKQEGNELVCQNCGNRFGTGDVEVTRGGCNPVPITSEDKTVNDTSITISKKSLSEAKVIFANWKS